MPTRTRPYRLFEAYHASSLYHIVDRETLEVRPLAPELFDDATTFERVRGTMAWRRGTADHLIEVRSVRPARRIRVLHRRFLGELKALEIALAAHGAMLLPSGAHPWMDPATEATLPALPDMAWLHTCHRLFDCGTHGWSNNAMARTYITFHGDAEFSRVHAAVRLLLPIVPALAASSPFRQGRWTGFRDGRMEACLHAHEQIPDLMGSVVPEPAFDQEEYYRQVYAPLAQALAAHDAHDLDHEQLNSRGAVPHFSDGLLELRIADTQECPAADLAVAEFLIAVLKALSTGRWVSTYLQRAWSEADLLAILLQVIKDAGHTLIANRDYLLMFGLLNQERMTAMELWRHLFVELYDELSDETRQHLAHVLEHGCLASRILGRTGKEPGKGELRTAYGELADCLREDKLFV